VSAGWAGAAAKVARKSVRPIGRVTALIMGRVVFGQTVTRFEVSKLN
jgi:hypothetical protein